VLIYLVIGLVLLALVNVVLGGAGWFSVLRLMLIYGGVFLLLMYLFGRMRDR
jgi:hypothetical protein